MKPQTNGAIGVLGSIISNPSKSENAGLGLTACFFVFFGDKSLNHMSMIAHLVLSLPRPWIVLI